MVGRRYEPSPADSASALSALVPRAGQVAGVRFRGSRRAGRETCRGRSGSDVRAHGSRSARMSSNWSRRQRSARSLGCCMPDDCFRDIRAVGRGVCRREAHRGAGPPVRAARRGRPSRSSRRDSGPHSSSTGRRAGAPARTGPPRTRSRRARSCRSPCCPAAGDRPWASRHGTDIREAFLTLACALMCWRRLRQSR
jgi:hypothetical protein